MRLKVAVIFSCLKRWNVLWKHLVRLIWWCWRYDPDDEGRVILITLGFEIVYPLGSLCVGYNPADYRGLSFMNFSLGINDICMHIYLSVYSITFWSHWSICKYAQLTKLQNMTHCKCFEDLGTWERNHRKDSFFICGSSTDGFSLPCSSNHWVCIGILECTVYGRE